MVLSTYNDNSIENLIIADKLESEKKRINFISVLYVGRIHEEKGILEFIDILLKHEHRLFFFKV